MAASRQAAEEGREMVSKEQKLSDFGIAAYQRRRRWSKTDTARWLNDRHATVVAYLRRRGCGPVGNVTSVGFWLKEERHPELFEQIHNRLLAMENDEAREAALVGRVLL